MKTLFCLRIDRTNILPIVAHRYPWHRIKVSFKSWNRAGPRLDDKTLCNERGHTFLRISPVFRDAHHFIDRIAFCGATWPGNISKLICAAVWIAKAILSSQIFFAVRTKLLMKYGRLDSRRDGRQATRPSREDSGSRLVRNRTLRLCVSS